MKLLFIILVCLAQVGCKYWGTEGGNPLTDENMGQTTTVSYLLAEVICERRDICQEQSDNLCVRKALYHNRVTTELKMNPPYQTLFDLINAEDNKQIDVSTGNFKACAIAIGNLDCANPSMAPFDYENLHLSLRSSIQCSEIFELVR